MKQFTTTIQYKSGTKLRDEDNNVYLVKSSIDLGWLYKDDNLKGKYLTNCELIGIFVEREDNKE